MRDEPGSRLENMKKRTISKGELYILISPKSQNLSPFAAAAGKDQIDMSIKLVLNAVQTFSDDDERDIQHENVNGGVTL